MPGDLQGVEFIEQVRELEQSLENNNNNKRIKMALNTAGESVDVQKQVFLSTLDASYVLKGDKKSLSEFFKSINITTTTTSTQGGNS